MMTIPTPDTVRSVPPDFNLAHYVAAPSELRRAEAIALTMVQGHERTDWTWRAIWSRMAAWQQLLAKYSLKRGDRIVLFLPNCVDVPALMLAASALGFVPVVLSPQLSASELAYIVTHSRAALRIGGPLIESLAHVAHIRPTDLEDALQAASSPSAMPEFVELANDAPGYMVYTSGTTGTPRGVLHAHRAVWARRMMVDGWTGIGADDIIVHAGQLNWTYAMGIAIFDAWALGARSVIYEGPRNARRWAELLEDEEATIFAAVPGLYRQLVRDIDDLRTATRTLRHGLCAGEPLPATLWEEWTSRTGKPLYEALGMSECSTYVSSGPSSPTLPGSPGRPQRGRRIAILPVDTGEEPLPAEQSGMLAIHSSEPGLMLGYFDDEAATAAAFRGPWFLTGDIASVDLEGYLHFEGRNDDTINALGYRVGPAEVEAVLSRHPAVSEVAVTGYSPRPGVVLVCAHLVLRDGFIWDEATRASVEALSALELAAYKQPRLYRVHPTLPRNRAGKILRRALRDAEPDA